MDSSANEIIYIAGADNKEIYKIGGCKANLKKHFQTLNRKKSPKDKLSPLYIENVDSYQECKKEIRSALKLFKLGRKDDFDIDYQKLLAIVKQVIQNRKALAALIDDAGGRPVPKEEKSRPKISKGKAQAKSFGDLPEDEQRDLIKQAINDIRGVAPGAVVIARKELEAAVKEKGYKAPSRELWKKAKLVAQDLVEVGLKW